MKNIKTLLRLMAATTLITTVASSIVACDFETKGPILNGKYAKLLDWYSDKKMKLLVKKSIQLRLMTQKLWWLILKTVY